MEFSKLREYQQNSILALREGVRKGHNSQVLVAPTGSGKTVIAASILGEASKKGTSAHFLCDRISLVDQTSAVLDFYGIPHGLIQGNHWRARPWERIQVVSVATVSRRKGKKKNFMDQEFSEPKLVIWDECFPAGTMIDGIPIEDIKTGDFVSSYNHELNIIEKRKVLGLIKRSSSLLYTANLSNGNVISCTINHPIFNGKEYVPMYNIRAGDIFYIGETHENVRSVMQYLLKKARGYSKILWAKSKIKFFYMLDCLRRTKKEECKSGIFREDEKISGGRRVEKDDRKQSIENAECSGQDKPKFKKNWASSKSSWREWCSYIGAAKNSTRSAWRWLVNRVCGSNKSAKRKRTIYALQDRHCESKITDRDRSGWREPLFSKKKRAGHKKDHVLKPVRVENIEVFECGSSGECGQSGVDVFNFEVEGNNNYFANGVLVHNCHASSTVGLEYCANPNVQVIGLTATPFSKWMGGSFTNIVNSTTTNQLIDEGFLVPLKYYAAKEADMSGVKAKFDGEWEDKGMEEKCLKIVGDVVEEWIGITHKYFNGPAKTICFSASVAHGSELCEQFQSRGYNFQQISYMDKDDESRRQKIKEFRKPDSSIDGLVSCEALTKGFDVPDIRIGIGARPYRKSLSGHIQQIGRVMRTAPGKDFGVWIDHSGNVLRFLEDMQTVFAEGVEDLNNCSLDGKGRKEPDEEEKKKHKCHACGFVHSVSICPACGAERPRAKSKVDNVAGQMTEVDVNGKKALHHEWMADKGLVWKELCVIAGEMKKDYQAAEKFAMAQFKNIFGGWPNNQPPYEKAVSSGVEPRKQVRGKVTANLIAYRFAIKKYKK